MPVSKTSNEYLISIVIISQVKDLFMLQKTLPKILNLTGSNYEICLCIFGLKNTMPNQKVLSTQILKNKKINLHTFSENFGIPKNKNLAVNKALGKYILLLDNDILINNKDFLKTLLNFYQTLSNHYQKIGFIYTPVITTSQTKTKFYGLFYGICGIRFNLPYLNLNYLEKLQNPVQISSPEGKNIFFEKIFWDQFNGFDETQPYNLDDIDIGPRASLLGFNSYLNTKSHLIDIGFNRAQNNPDYEYRFKYLFSGHARSMIKNFTLKNLIWRFPVFCFYMFFKTIAQSIIRKKPLLFICLIKSIIIFIKNLPDTLKQRRKTQKSRLIKNDLFLKIKPPIQL